MVALHGGAGVTRPFQLTFSDDQPKAHANQARTNQLGQQLGVWNDILDQDVKRDGDNPDGVHYTGDEKQPHQRPATADTKQPVPVAIALPLSRKCSACFSILSKTGIGLSPKTT